MKKRFIDKIITRLGKYFLERNARANNQEREFVTFKNAKKIGIVYNALKPEEAKLVLAFALKLEKLGKSVNTLGYLNRKVLGGDYIPNYRNDYFCNRDLNQMRLPKEMSVKRFISEPYDYLLNLYTQDDFALIGISSLSRARFRIGNYWKEYVSCFDLMLKPNDSSVETLISEITHYIKINE